MNLKKLSGGILGGSLILLVTINVFFVLNYFFHFAMARMLSIEQYGVLVTLYSLIYILAIFAESIQLVISKYTTNEKDDGRVKNLFRKSSRKAIKIAFYLFLSFLFLGIILSKILKIDYPLIALTGLIIFSSFLMPLTRGILQGRKRFTSLGLNMISESVVKLIAAVLLVLAGLMIYGAVIATLLGTYISLLLSLGSIKDILGKDEKKGRTPGIYGYSAPVFIVIVTIVLFYSIDVIIARIVFSAEITGYYAVASMIAKVIFFGTMPISKAMFPITTDSKNKKDSSKTFKRSLLILMGCISIALFVVYFFPELLIKVFSGDKIPEIERILILPALAVSFISMSNMILLYKLSVGKIKYYPFLLVFFVIELFAMVIFSSNLLTFSIAFLVSAILLFIGSSIIIRN
ncbi:MAG: oligosaccharide flippase family protein [Nanoarchaeota archaeon]|nr:oligosaccharide flippase family protein [Nanoarchaeota archaeon]